MLRRLDVRSGAARMHAAVQDVLEAAEAGGIITAGQRVALAALTSQRLEHHPHPHQQQHGGGHHHHNGAHHALQAGLS